MTFASGEGPQSVLEGFTLRDGTGTVSGPTSCGGGIYCLGSSPTIRGNELTASSAGRGGGIYSNGGSPMILGNKIFGNGAGRGGGVYCTGGSPAIRDNRIQGNDATVGGGFHCTETRAVLQGNTIQDNLADGGSSTLGIGGGGCIVDSGAEGNPLLVQNNLFDDYMAYAWNSYPDLNSAYGGGLTVLDSTVHVDHCTFSENWAESLYHGETYGGALCLGCDSLVTVSNSILYYDHAVVVGGYELAISCDAEPFSTIRFEYSDVQYGPGAFYISDPGNTAEWGVGMISETPRFVAGNHYYLAQVAAGQAWNSPCVDAGDPQGLLVEGTTRTDGRPDEGVTDMGFHYPAATAPLVVAGPGPSPDNPPLVRIFPAEQDAAHLFEFPAYGTPGWGVNVAAATLDGVAGFSVLTGPGPGSVFGPHVRGFEPDGTPLPGLSCFAYGTLKYGVNVAAGDLDGDGRDEIIVAPGPDPAAGSPVKAYRYSAGEAEALFSLEAFDGLPRGATVAAGRD